MQYEYWLAALYQLPDEKKRLARTAAGSAKELYEMSGESLKAMHIFEPAEISILTESKRMQDISYVWDDFLKKKISFVPYFSEEYPENLLNIYDPPYALYVKGRLPDPEKKSVAIVGARACSEYGRSIAKMLGKVLSLHNVQVISGMAMGVDSASHAGALSVGGDTFAILGGGCDLCYPKSSHNI
ncbi:MAG: DNA-protecting protein DprA, partial [Clostridiales bacterium]|nr:DNA-protecting protein DprA [Clostridiales bacterium]